MDSLLALHGYTVLAGLLAASAAGGWLAVFVVRRRRATRRWRARVGARPRRALAVGPLAVRGVVLADNGLAEEDLAVQTIAFGAAPAQDAHVLNSRAPGLRLRTVGGVDVELRGEVVVTQPGARVADDDEDARRDAKSALDPELHWLFDEVGLERRELRRGERVLAFGELVRDAGPGSGYRDGADSFALRPAKGMSHVVLHRTPRVRAWWGAPAGVALLLIALVGAWWMHRHDWGPRHHFTAYLLPWARPFALRRLRADLADRVDRGYATREEAQLRLTLDPDVSGLPLARTLVHAGRRDEARATVERWSDDPYARAAALSRLGFGDDAYTELRAVDTVEARAHEAGLRLRSSGGLYPGAQRFAHVLDRVCEGPDWTCAAHWRLLWSRGLRERPPLGWLRGHPLPRSVEEVELWLTIAGREPMGDARSARARIRWQLALAEHQLKRGADAAARETLAAARGSIARWPAQTRDLARDVDHYEAALALWDGRADAARVHGPRCPVASLVAATRGEPIDDRDPTLPPGIHSMLLDVRAGRPIVVVPNDVTDYRALPWLIGYLDAESREELADRVASLGPLARLGDHDFVIRQTLRARALARLGRRDLAEETRAQVQSARRGRYGW